jgi:hypothetical protein
MQAPRTETQAHVIVQRVPLDYTFPPALSSGEKIETNRNNSLFPIFMRRLEKTKKNQGNKTVRMLVVWG